MKNANGNGGGVKMLANGYASDMHPAMAPKKPVPAVEPGHAAKVKRIMALYRSDFQLRAKAAEIEYDKFLGVLTGAGYDVSLLTPKKPRYLAHKFLQLLGVLEWHPGRFGRWVVPETRMPPAPDIPAELADLPSDQLEMLLRATLAARSENSTNDK